MNKRAIILIGFPGAGKSTLAETLVKQSGGDYAIHSTDMFFMRNGEYQFDATKLEEYHRENESAFGISLARGVPLVICDNTNLRSEHWKPYFDRALIFSRDVQIIHVGVFQPLNLVLDQAKRSMHKVPETTIRAMFGRFWTDRTGMIPN